MATPGELVKCIAEALGIPEPTVVLYDRVLAENGLRSKGGRGTSAARVTSGDAANLLIAILASPVSGSSIKTATETCKIYGQLRLRLGHDADNRETCSSLGFSTLARMPRSHTFREAVAMLIDGAILGEELFVPNDEDESDPLTGPDMDWFVGIEIDGPNPWTQIIVDGSIGTGDVLARFVFHNHKKMPPSKRRLSSRSQRAGGDMSQQRSISYRTIRRVGQLLAETVHER